MARIVNQALLTLHTTLLQMTHTGDAILLAISGQTLFLATLSNLSIKFLICKTVSHSVSLTYDSFHYPL